MANLRFPILCVFLFLAVVLESTTMVSCSTASVYIFNRIKSQIQVQCWNKDRHIVIHPTVLKNEEHVGVVFKPSIWGKSKINCDFLWSSMELQMIYVQTFDVWDGAFFFDPLCQQCTWIVDPMGFTEHKDGELGPVVAHWPWVPQK